MDRSKKDDLVTILIRVVASAAAIVALVRKERRWARRRQAEQDALGALAIINRIFDWSYDFDARYISTSNSAEEQLARLSRATLELLLVRPVLVSSHSWMVDEVDFAVNQARRLESELQQHVTLV